MGYENLILNRNDLLPIDKIIIREDRNFQFNIFKINSNKKPFILYDKGEKLTKEVIEILFDEKHIYIDKQDKDIYTTIYDRLISKDHKSQTIENLYFKLTKQVDKMLEIPESLTNKMQANNVVTKMMEYITADDFTLKSLITILSYDYYTHTHSLNTCIYALCLGKELELKGDELKDLGVSALLHDLGKSQINKAIINKDGELTDSQFKEVKNHSIYGYNLAQKLQINKKSILSGIRNHHEKMDGSGYPDGLKKYEIHPFARIIGICDIFDALTTKKSYKDITGTYDTLMMMKKDMKKELDINMVDKFITLFHTK